MSKKLVQYFSITLLLTFGITSALAQRDKKKVTGVSDELRLAQAEAFFVEGEKYFILEDYTKALLFFNRAVELNPDDAGTHFKVAETLSKSATDPDINLAIASMETTLKLDQKNKYYYQLAAALYAKVQNFSKAASLLETMIRQIPGSEESLFDEAAYLLYANKPEEAIKVYNKAEEVFGIQETSSLQKQRIYLDQGKIKEAIQETERLITAFPEEPQYVMAFAELLSQNNQKPRAIQLLEKFNAENPGNGNVALLLSALYKESGQQSKGNALLLDVFHDGNVDVNTKILIVGALTAEIQMLRERNTPNQALEEFTVQLFRKLDESNIVNESVSMIGGDLFLTLKKNTEAKKYYTKAIQQGATGFDAWQNLLLLELQDNQFDSLIVHSEAGLELFPNQAALYYFNGFGHLRKRNYPEATYSLEQAKKLASGNQKLLGDINGMLGDAYNSMKQYAKSNKAYDDALAINPNNDFVLNNYSYFLALRNEKLDAAESMASKLIKLYPDNSTYLDTYGWVLYVREKYKEAKKIFERIVSLHEANATHLEHYGDVLYKLGDVEGAVKQWEKARTLTSNNETLNKKIANRKLN